MPTLTLGIALLTIQQSKVPGLISFQGIQLRQKFKGAGTGMP
jgi:hypothetical protein